MTTRVEKIVEIPSTAPGTSRTLKAISYGNPESRPKVYLQAALHADETPGILVLHYLQQLLDAADNRGEIIGYITLVPMANPLGTDQRVFGHMIGRYSYSTGVNFNRGHTDVTEQVVREIKGKLSDDVDQNTQLIRQALKKAVSNLPAQNEVAFLKRALLSWTIDADICLDLHCDEESMLYLFTTKSTQAQGEALSTQLGCEACISYELVNGDTFDEAAAVPWVNLAKRFPDKPIAPPPMSITVEYRGQSEVYPDQASEDARRLFKYLQRTNIIEGDPGTLPSAICKATPLSGLEHVRAPEAGLVVHIKEVGAHVNAGDVVSRLLNPYTSVMQDIKTRVTGKVLSRCIARMVGQGEVMVAVVGDQPFERVAGETLLSD
jgi:predicted deacylase